jgi:general secretion pathway protein F
VLGNAVLQQVIVDASSSIREGESIAEPLKASGRFPPLVTHMIAVGERSGQLEEMLENVALSYDSQVENRVAALTSLLEPLMIVIMGLGAGSIAVAILMPLMKMSEFVQ